MEFSLLPRFMLYILSIYLPYRQLYFFAKVNVSTFLLKWTCLKYWVSTVAFEVLVWPHASYLVQAIQKHVAGISTSPVDLILQHPPLQCGVSCCAGSLFPPLLDSQPFFFNRYKSVDWKCYTTWGTRLSVSKHKDTIFLPLISFRRVDKWVENSRGYLKRYVKEVSSDGKRSGIIFFPVKIYST